MNTKTIILTRENLHELSGSPGKCGFTRKQVEALGFSWPPKKGWLSSLIGKEISPDEYEHVRSLIRKKWKSPANDSLPACYQSTITAGEFLEQMKSLNIPMDATIKTAERSGFRPAQNMSFCRTANEISLW